MESSIIGYCILALSLALLAASGCLLIFGKRVDYSYSVSSYSCIHIPHRNNFVVSIAKTQKMKFFFF